MRFPGRSPLPVHAGDLLLILIVSLGSARLLGPLLISAFGDALTGPPEGRTVATIALVLFLLTVQAAILLLAVYLVVVRWRGLDWGELGLVAPERAWYPRAVVIALLTFPLVAAINLGLQALHDQPLRNPQLELLAPTGFSWWGLFGTLLVAGVFAPFVEELVFRGLFYRWLRERIGFWGAVIISAFAFSVLHGIPGLIPAIAALGVVLALIYEKSGSLWPAIVAHGTYNTVVTIGLYAALAYGVGPG